MAIAQNQSRLSHSTLARGAHFALGSLIVVHLLTTTAVGVLRNQQIGTEWQNWLSLAAGQFCLLGLWLSAGGGRFTTRLTVAVTTACLLFAIVAQSDFSSYAVARGSYWLDDEWNAFFAPQGVGTLAVQMPYLILGVALPVGALRVSRSGGGGWQWRLRFDTQTLLLGMAAGSAMLMAVFQMAPYANWFPQFAQRWWQHQRLFVLHQAISAAPIVANVLTTLVVAHWMASRRSCWRFMLVLGVVAAELALRRLPFAYIGSPLVTGVLVGGTLEVIRWYGRQE